VDDPRTPTKPRDGHDDYSEHLATIKPGTASFATADATRHRRQSASIWSAAHRRRTDGAAAGIPAAAFAGLRGRFAAVAARRGQGGLIMRFAFYGRVSTEDQQDPEASRNWQLGRAKALVDKHGEIVAQYFDVGQSRSIPWKRRPEATRLLAAMRNPDRGFDAIVIGEPQRAFYGNQYGLTFPLLVHYGVGLWVPEVGGAIEPESEAHDLVMSVFGGMSKGERNRIKIRVRAAMAAQASVEGRFLGGRPPYGYRLADAGPHPNPAKAAEGKRLARCGLLTRSAGTGLGWQAGPDGESRDGEDIRSHGGGHRDRVDGRVERGSEKRVVPEARAEGGGGLGGGAVHDDAPGTGPVDRQAGATQPGGDRVDPLLGGTETGARLGGCQEMAVAAVGRVGHRAGVRGQAGGVPGEEHLGGDLSGRIGRSDVGALAEHLVGPGIRQPRHGHPIRLVRANRSHPGKADGRGDDDDQRRVEGAFSPHGSPFEYADHRGPATADGDLRYRCLR
jgi:DNA invertase Pin-like site-specific DNA recombinase